MKTTQREIHRDKNLSLAEQVYAILRKKLITLQIRPRAILVEARLAEEYSVSKTPVREALMLLKRDGFLELLPRIGYRVIPMSVQDIHEVYNLRALLEGEAATLAANRTSEEDLRVLLESEQARAQEFSRNSKDPFVYLEFHDSCHMTIARLSGNNRLVTMISNLYDQSIRLRLCDPRMSLSHLVEAERDTEQIWRAFLEHNCNEAGLLMKQHILKAKERLLRCFLGNGMEEVIELSK